MIRTFFRIVQTNPLSERDFSSHERLGMPVIDPALRDLQRGISVYSTLTQASSTMRRFPSTGRWIAVLELDDEKMRFERTPRGPGHHTVWSEPAALLECVVEVWEPPALAPSDH
jgi:hypothetical protein